MTAQRVIAIFIVISSSLLCASVLPNDFAYPGILCMLGLLGLERRFTWDLGPERRVIRLFLLLVLLLVFGLHYRFASTPDYGRADPTATLAWQTVTRYFLASMILMLYLGEPKRLPLSLGLFHLAIVISAGQVLLLEDHARIFRPLELLAVTSVMLFIASARPPAAQGALDTPRRSPRLLFAFLCILLVTLNTGWILGSVLYRHQGTLNYLGMRLLGNETQVLSGGGPASAIGFSNSGELSSIAVMKSKQDLDPVLRIKSELPPHYLRARAFETYLNSGWQDRANEDPIFPERTRFGLALGGMVGLYRMVPSLPVEPQEMTVEHLVDLGRTMFTPLSAAEVEVGGNTLLLNENNLVYSRTLKGRLAYRVTYDAQPYRNAPRSSQRRRMLRLPGDLDPGVRRLADRLFADCTTTGQKIEAVVRHFHDNYDYSLDISLPPNRDKVTYFLLNETSGYCEYFASGTALLLRMADVPTRYVTGFYVMESDSPGSWIARNANAHAWVEAWDAERRRWEIVESTVQEELASGPLGPNEAGTDAGGRFWWQQLLQATYEYGILGLLIWLSDFGGPLLNGVVALLLALALALPLLRYGRKKWPWQKGQQGIGPLGQRQRDLQRLLRKMDRQLRRKGLRRLPVETVKAFSGRLAISEQPRAARWYDRYNTLRFRPHPSAEEIGVLRREIP